ncbi:MAG: hypothetical protein AB1714_27055 [Acidobacteriota bacterium]
MKRIACILLVPVGIVSVALGLLFVVGAAGQAARYTVALLLLAAGAILIGVGLRLYKQAEAVSPERLRGEIMEVARRRNGEISWADVEAALGARARHATSVLDTMSAEGLCERLPRAGSWYYVFRDLQPRLAVRTCEYCGAEFRITDATTTCPSCGGQVKTRTEARSVGGADVYKMDE